MSAKKTAIAKSNSKSASSTASKRLPNPNETRFMLRLPNVPDNDVYGMLETLAKRENRSLNNMVVELIKRAGLSKE